MNRATPSNLHALANPGECSSSLDQARLRILRCTARAMASSPGGLRFVTGAKPWLEGLTGGAQPSRQSDPQPKRLFTKSAA